MTLVNPMDETPRARGRAAPRLESLAGRTLVLLDISKPGGKVFLDYIQRLLIERYGVGRIIRESKPTFAKPAPDSSIQRILSARCDGVIEALAD